MSNKEDAKVNELLWIIMQIHTDKVKSSLIKGAHAVMSDSNLVCEKVCIDCTNGDIIELAANGDITHINLQIKDICKTDLEGLPLHATASLFGKVRQITPSDHDVALGIICMVLESIGSAAVLSKLNTGVKDFVLIGNLTRLPQCAVVFPRIEEIYGVKFHIPAHAEFCTALGAALAYNNT